MADLDQSARHVYAVAKADSEIKNDHPQRAELDDKKTQYDSDFQSTVLNVFDKLLFPGKQGSADILRSKVLDATYPAGEPYNGERQIVKTLTFQNVSLTLGTAPKVIQLALGEIKVDAEFIQKTLSQLRRMPRHLPKMAGSPPKPPPRPARQTKANAAGARPSPTPPPSPCAKKTSHPPNPNPPPLQKTIPFSTSSKKEPSSRQSVR